MQEETNKSKFDYELEIKDKMRNLQTSKDEMQHKY